MSIDIMGCDDIQLLRKYAKAMGVTVTNFDKIDKIKAKIAEALGDLGFTDTTPMISDDTKEKAKASAVDLILSGKAELGGLSSYPTDLPRGKMPNLLPFQNPWGGRRRRVKRLMLSENDQQILFIHWNGYPFVMGLEAEYADIPYPHFMTLLSATSERMRQKKVLDQEGRANWENVFYEIKNFPIQDMGVTPGTEHLPRSMKEYIYSAYVEGFPAFTPLMWKQVAQSYSYSNKELGIIPSMDVKTQVLSRRMAVMDRLGIIDLGDAKKDRPGRAEVIADLLAESPIAEAA